MYTKAFYKNFSSKDFIADEKFQNWVLKFNENREDDFWKEFLEEYPEQKPVVEAAKKALLQIPFRHITAGLEPSEEKIQGSFQHISRLLGLGNSGKKLSAVPLSASRWWWAAASVILLFSLGFYFFYEKAQPPLARTSVQLLTDVEPGGHKATLTLGNGQTILLDQAGNDTLSTEGGAAVVKLADGKIAYEESPVSVQETVYHMITTPAGGQYNLTLSDGSRVWLNAASSLRFPAAFNGKYREVSLTGEGYFEVAADEEKSFRVSAQQSVVEVLGTQFNINAYADEPTLRTTLLEGSVKVDYGIQHIILKPDQQGVLDLSSGSLYVNNKITSDEAIAWKNGLFQFENTDLHSIMRQIGRWYNVEVIFEKNVTAQRFTGKIYRNINASEVFKILETLGVHFKIDGRRVTVTR